MTQEIKPGGTEAVVSVVELTKLQVEKTGIQFGEFEKRNLREVLRVNGYLHVPPQNKAQVSTFMGGIVKAVLVREGDFVHQGQALIDLVHPDFLKLQEDYLVQGAIFSFQKRNTKGRKNWPGITSPPRKPSRKPKQNTKGKRQSWHRSKTSFSF